MATSWDARSYDRTSAPQQSWAADVLARLEGIAPDSVVLDVGCGTGRVTEALLELVPQGRVLAIDASQEMVALARERLDDRAEVWCQSALDLDLREELDVVVSTATLHWVPEHDRLWVSLAQALRSGGVLEAQCGGAGNIARVREAIGHAAQAHAPELVGFSPWVFATPEETETRLVKAGFGAIRCWLEERPTFPEDVDEFVRTSILAAHLERLSPAHRDAFARAVAERVAPATGLRPPEHLSRAQRRMTRCEDFVTGCFTRVWDWLRQELMRPALPRGHQGVLPGAQSVG